MPCYGDPNSTVRGLWCLATGADGAGVGAPHRYRCIPYTAWLVHMPHEEYTSYIAPCMLHHIAFAMRHAAYGLGTSLVNFPSQPN